MSTRTSMTVVALLLAITAFQAGCSRPRPLPYTGSRPAFPIASEETSTSLEALTTSMEMTSVIPASRAWWPAGLKEVPKPARGDRIMWMRWTVTNGSDATGTVILRNTYPRVIDASGKTRPLLYPRVSSSKATTLGPGSTVVLILLYDVPSPYQPYRIAWPGGDGAFPFPYP